MPAKYPIDARGMHDELVLRLGVAQFTYFMRNNEQDAANIPSDVSTYEQMAEDLDELMMVPTDVLADWVTARGRCLWESTFGEPPWVGEDDASDADRELATRMCAGCPVRAECLELELRTAGEDTLGVWGGLNQDNRVTLHRVWSRRRRDEVEALADDDCGEVQS